MMHIALSMGEYPNMASGEQDDKPLDLELNSELHLRKKTLRWIPSSEDVSTTTTYNWLVVSTPLKNMNVNWDD